MSVPYFTCRYCFERKPDSDRSEEHVIPAAAGGALTISDLCLGCQKYAGENVDRPFLRAVPILEARHHHGVRDRNGRVPEAVRLRGRIRQDDTEVLVTVDRVDPGLRLLPVEEWPDDQTVRFGADASEYEEHKKLKLERLARKYQTVEDLGAESRKIENPSVVCDHTSDRRLKISVDLWARFVAKIGLALAPGVLGEGWMGTEPAIYLRSVMRGERPAPLPGFQDLRREPERLWESDGAQYFRPPEHVVLVNQVNDAAILRVILFGEYSYGVPLGRVSLPANPPMWIFDPVSRRVEQLPSSLWLARMAERFDRPRPPYHPRALTSAG